MTPQWLLIGMSFMLTVLLVVYNFKINKPHATIIALLLTCGILWLANSLSLNLQVVMFYGLSILVWSQFSRVVNTILLILGLIFLGLLLDEIITEIWIWYGLLLLAFGCSAWLLIQNKSGLFLSWLGLLFLAALNLIVSTPERQPLMALLMVSLQFTVFLKATGTEKRSTQTISVTEIQQAERSRIYQNIHDDVGAELLRLIYILDNSDHKHQVKAIMQKLRQAVAQTTRVKMDTHQLSRDITGLFSERLNAADIRFQCTRRIDYNHVFNNTHPSTLLRMMNELLNNIIRHARARKVHIQLISDKQQLSVHVIDDGCGLSKNDGDLTSGRGFRGLQKRAAEIGASITWKNNPNGGLITTLSYPWP